LKNELTIFLCVLILLSIGMHYKEFLNYPLEHFFALPNSSVYGFGFLHPLFFSIIIYILLLIPRFVFRLILRKK